MINDLLDKLEEANRIFGAGIATGVQNHADVELCRKQVDDEINKMRAEIAELKGLLEE